MADFINYGDLQLEQLALLNDLANNVQNYVNTQPWSNKRKEKFMSAYSDIMNNGVLGASNSTGQWVLNTRNAIDLNSKDRKDREMYLEAAYFIQQQMAGLSSKAATEKEQEEKKKEELPTFDNEYFTNGFKTKLSNMWYGGNRNISINSDWNTLDERGENGLRGTSVRRERLAQTLESYLKDFDETKVNFENSPFKDADDFRNRLNTAISKLRSGEDVTDALNAIGLRSSDWFYDGSGDLYIDENGNSTTYGQYAESKIKLEQQKALEEALLKLLKANAMRGILSLVGGIHAVEARNTPEAYQEYLTRYGTGQAGFNAVNNRVSELINKGYDKQLTGADKKELGNLLYYIRSNNPNYKGLGDGTHTNVTDKEWEDLRLHTNSLSSVNRGNFIRLPWQTHDGRYTYVDNKGNLYFLKPNNGQKFTNPAIRSKGYYDYKNNFLRGATVEDRRQLAGERKVNDGEWQTEDYLRMGAMGQDIAGTIAALLPGYGTAASGALGLTSLGTQMAADIADDSVSKSDVIKNAGINLGLGIVGLVPGLGLATKTGKWMAQAAKWAPRILTLAAAGQVALSDDIKSSIAKLASNETLTVNDWKNVGYALSTVAGVARGARGIVDNRKYSRAFKGGDTQTEKHIITKSGKTVKASEEQIKEINKIGKEQGTEAANKYLNEQIIKNPASNEDVGVSFKRSASSLGRRENVKTMDKTINTSASPRVQAYLRKLRMQNEYRKSGLGMYKFAPRFLPTSYDIYSGAANLNLPQWKIFDNLKKAWNPISEGKIRRLSSGTGSTNTPNNPNLLSNSPLINRPEPPLNIKKPILTNTQYKGRNMNEVEWQGRLATKGLKEIDLFLKSYGEGNNSSKFPFVGGYGSSKNKIKAGEYSFDLGNGQKVTFKISKEDISKKSIGELRNRIQKQIKDQVLNKTDKATVGNILRKLKKQGFLKQGGKITDTQIDNFLKQYK